MEETNSEIFLRTCTKHEDIGSIHAVMQEDQVMKEARKMDFVFVLIHESLLIRGDCIRPITSCYNTIERARYMHTARNPSLNRQDTEAFPQPPFYVNTG